MTTASPTPAGWYPDPESPQSVRYWDGRNWTSQTHPSASPAADPALDRNPVPGNLTVLARAVQILVGLTGLLSLFLAGLDLWGFGLIGAAVRSPQTVDLDAVDRYDQLSSIGSVLALGALAIAGVTWISWQYRLANHVPRAALRRSPGWQIAAWFVPVVALWYPLQNLGDLRGALTGARTPSRAPGGYLVWWLAWTASNIVSLMAVRLSGQSETLSALADTILLMAIGDLLEAGAAVLAIAIVADLTRRARVSPDPVGDIVPA
jgi:Protein of unknown function (DUF2510).